MGNTFKIPKKTKIRDSPQREDQEDQRPNCESPPAHEINSTDQEKKHDIAEGKITQSSEGHGDQSAEDTSKAKDEDQVQDDTEDEEDDDYEDIYDWLHQGPSKSNEEQVEGVKASRNVDLKQASKDGGVPRYSPAKLPSISKIPLKVTGSGARIGKLLSLRIILKWFGVGGFSVDSRRPTSGSASSVPSPFSLWVCYANV